MKFLGKINDVEKGLKILGFEKEFENVTVTLIEGFSGINIYGEDKNFTIEYETKTDLYRGLTLLSGMLKKGENSVSIKEDRRFNSCGIMIDCSRNSVPRVDTLKDLFCRIAKMGLNMVLLYTEDTYEIENYPYFGYMRGKYTKEELKELDKYAQNIGIELIPCIQTLAHIDMALRWPTMISMSDSPDVLLVDSDATYDFIDAMFKSCRECFSTNRIHIGMDEANSLGRGRFLRNNPYETPDKLFLRHLKKVTALADKYGFSPMMWDDMFFRYSSKVGGYYDLETVLDPDIKKEIPTHISQVFWDYYHEKNSEYETYFKQREALDNEVVFAGGIWTWYTLGIAYNKSFRATKSALEECAKAGVKTVFGTMWDGGNGGYLNVYGCLLGMQLYAEYMYNETVSREHIKERFNLCTGYDMDAFMALDIDNYPTDWCHNESTDTEPMQDPNVSKQVLYQDILLGVFDKNIECFDLRKYYGDKIKNFDQVEIPTDLEYMFDYHKTLLKALSLKSDMGLRITKAYKEKDTKTAEKLIDELYELKDTILDLRNKMYEMWNKEHKIFCWDVTDLRLYGLVGRTETAISQLKKFVADKNYVIEELEEEKLLYGPSNLVKEKGLTSCIRFSTLSTAGLTAR